MMIAWAIFRNSWALQAATAILVGWIAWSSNNVYQRHVGAAKVVEASKKAGQVANAKNEKVRRAAAEPGAAARLLHDACRDCR